jgi:hypothetical protein
MRLQRKSYGKDAQFRYSSNFCFASSVRPISSQVYRSLNIDLVAMAVLTNGSHANAHCIMKILKGSLKETRYAWPTVDRNNAEDRPLQVLSDKTYHQNQVTYMSDKLGLHRISNPDPNGYAVSLHRRQLNLEPDLKNKTDHVQYTLLLMLLYTVVTFLTRTLDTPRT